jgi:hypothetical protein
VEDIRKPLLFFGEGYCNKSSQVNINPVENVKGGIDGTTDGQRQL